MIMLYLLKYWKEGLIGLVLIAFSLFVIDYSRTKRILAITEYQLEEAQRDMKAMQTTLDVFYEVSRDQQKRLDSAEEERLTVMKRMSQDINNMKNQKVPKDCGPALDWAIENRGDLSWPK